MLYIGTNYHPHDWSKERWKQDIALMKQAGMTTVRLGHLCWDSYEPQEGVYTFEWFDEVMDLFAQAGIGVFLDISTRPAPIWVHKLCPGCNVCSKEGIEQESLQRYMEDVDDPGFQHYALRFAKILVNRYKDHPALFGFGLCNELGAGIMSYSDYAKKRFQNWLKKKYGTIEALNHAWATQRWCRRLADFSEVVLMENAVSTGAPEAWLDMRRFYSDGIANYLVRLRQVVEENAPGKQVSGNLYCNQAKLGFDYLKYVDQLGDTYPAQGYYAMYDVEADIRHQFVMESREMIQESGKPLWYLEFQTGRNGIFCGPKGFLHMQLMTGLLNRAELFLGWTWRSMYGGKEQYHHGILGHDGLPTPNYEEMKQAAATMKKLEKYGFPYLPEPDTAVAYDHDSWWMQMYQKGQFRQPYYKGLVETQRAFEDLQKEYNVVNLKNLKKKYKLLVVPGQIIMDEKSAETIRSFVEEGGTVVMTGYSGTVNEDGQVFKTPRPGRLTDVFGIRIRGFYRTDMPGFFSENASIYEENGQRREAMRITGAGQELLAKIDYYEDLELNGAKAYAEYPDKEMTAVSVHRYGKGSAYYVAAEANEEILEWLIGNLTKELSLEQGLTVPKGVLARKISEGQYFYVNTTKEKKEICLPEGGYGVLTEAEYEKSLLLDAYQSELIVAK